MIKKILIIFATLLIIAIGLFIYLVCVQSQTDVWVDREHGRICDMPISGSPLMVEVVPGLHFRIDSGSDVSAITEADLAKLDSMGYKVEKSFGISLGRNSNGDISFSTTRYKVDIPTYQYHFVKDSLGNVRTVIDSTTLNVIHNVEFIPAPTDLSVLGVDFLEVFNLEYRHFDQAVSLYLDAQTNYESCVNISYSKKPFESIFLGKRYYLDAMIHDRPYHFFIDTGIRKASVKLPTSELVYNKNKLYKDTVESFRGVFPALVDKSVWMVIGDRGGRRKVFYYDNDEEPCAINPLLFFKQDMFINYSDGMILLRPFCDLPKTTE